MTFADERGSSRRVFDAWTKEFMEAGKERLTRDTVRDATRQEIEHLKRENYDLKQLVADPFPGGPPFQKHGHPDFGRGHRHMSAQERSNVITRVEQTQWGKRRLLAQLQVPRSTYYRWRARELQGKQECPAAITRVPWNRLSSPEEAAVLAAARESPEWSSRQLATWVTDHLRLSVGESDSVSHLEEGRTCAEASSNPTLSTRKDANHLS